MRIEDVLKTPDMLKSNFGEISSNLPFSAPEGSAPLIGLENLPTTHSFGYEKVFYADATKTISKSVYPARAILFDNCAFQSENVRNSHRPPGDFQPKRTMVKARNYGLDDYVFAYLGIHEYYYSQCGSSNTPAFGAFFPAELDNAIDANVTLFDLESPYSSSFTPEKMTLYPRHGRTVTSNEIHNKYSSNFFKYWICEDYEDNDFIDDNKWTQKREFHYKEEVKVDDLKAILWPLDLFYDEMSRTTKIKPSTLTEISQFSSKYPHISVYTYLWINSEGYARFTFASYLIGKELFQSGNLPTQRNFNDSFLKRFPLPIF